MLPQRQPRMRQRPLNSPAGLLHQESPHSFVHAEDQVTNRLGRPKVISDILHMPNELLEKIASYIVPDHDVEVIDGIPSSAARRLFEYRFGFEASTGSYPARLWRLELNDSRNLALVCHRFTPVIERLMYRRISMLEKLSYTRSDKYPKSVLPYLVRTLIERPDLAQRCTKLDTWIQERRLIKNTADPFLYRLNPYFEAFVAAIFHVDKVPNASLYERESWSVELARYQEAALHAVLITLLPSLRDLKLYAPMSHPKMFSSIDFLGRPKEITDFSCIDIALRNSSVTSVYAGIAWPIKHFPALTLTKMEIDIIFFADRIDLLNSTMVLPNVQSVSIVINFLVFNGRKLSQYTHALDARICLVIFLRDMVPNIRDFSIDMPRGILKYKQPFKMRDRWDNTSPTYINMADDAQDIDNHPMDDPDDPTPWEWLMEALQPIQKKLKSFSLPRNWYSSMGRMTTPLPSLEDFTSLEVLSLPRVSLVANPYSDAYDPSDDCAAVDFLPKSLKTLIIFQADVDCCAWVQGAFAQKASLFPNWQHLGLAFRNDYVAILPLTFEEEARKAELEVKAFWRGQYKTVV